MLDLAVDRTGKFQPDRCQAVPPDVQAIFRTHRITLAEEACNLVRFQTLDGEALLRAVLSAETDRLAGGLLQTCRVLSLGVACFPQRVPRNRDLELAVAEEEVVLVAVVGPPCAA